MDLLPFIRMLSHFLACIFGSWGRKKAVAVVLIVDWNKRNAVHSAASPAKCAAMRAAFVKSSVARTILSIVQDYVSIQGTVNAVGMLPVNTSVQHTSLVVAMG